MTLLQLQPGIVYGPINSRRLGRSLGINLLSSCYKLCSFDCVYCHYGRTQVKTLSPEEKDLPSVAQVLQAVQEALKVHHSIDYITFSGNGEPTLHPRFPAIVSGIHDLRDRLRPDIKLAVLSNSTTVHFPYILESLALLNVPMMKLDAGDSLTLAHINRPTPEVRFERIVEGLKRVPGLIIQSVLIGGQVTNVEGEAFEAWLSVLAEIRPTQVQIYSTDRPVPESGVKRVPPDALQHTAAEIEKRTGLQVNTYWARA